MKIAIDCADLDHERIDGTRVYIKNLLSWFGKIDTESEFLLYHKKDFNPLLKPIMYPNYIDRKIPYNFCWTQTRFAFELRKDKPDACFMPIQQIPFIGPEEAKYVVTIHDLAFKYFPDHFPFIDRKKIDFFTDTAIKRADKIIAISESTKKDILKFYPRVVKEKNSVVHHGFEREIFEKEYSQEEIDKTLKKYKITSANHQLSRVPGSRFAGLTTNYLLYVGAIQPRKNLVILIKAFEKIKKEFNDLKLVFVGEIAWKAESAMKTAERSSFSKDILFTGRVDFKDLAKIYQGAEVFVFPALYEGFGIPILEAFASKVPVVIADNSSLPEVAGDAAEKFRGNDSIQLANVLRKILKSPIMREKMIEKGIKRAEQFSWEKCARETLDILKS